MPFEQKSLDDYIDVAQRIADFRAKYPYGTLAPLDQAQPWRIVQAEGFERNGDSVTQSFVVVVAAAYRDRDDSRPGIGMAWEVFPGRTPYTRGSELQNAETSAWGRAIIAVGASDSKRGIASREEIRNREAEGDADRLIAEARAFRRKDPEVDEHGAATVAEQTRMITGAEPGAQRGPVPPAEDAWADKTIPAPSGPPEDQHGSSTADQIRRMQAAFTRMKIGDRDDKIAWLVSRFGPDIHSSKDLSYRQAAAALQEMAAPAVKAGADA